MKLWHWIVVLVVLYEGVIGIAELTSSLGSNPLAMLATLPSVGSVVQSSSGTSTTVSGGVDLAVAAALYFFVLHRHLAAA